MTRPPLIIRHRVNSRTELDRTDPGLGVEFDVRSRGGRLILAHDPGVDGEDLEPFLEAAAGQRRLLVFNPKEDGLEDELLRLARRCGVERYFLLDLTLPTLVRLAARQGVREVGVRVSEFEPEEGAMRFKDLAGWVWLDCFKGEPPAPALLRRLRRVFQVCLVSPELQGFPRERIARFTDLAGSVDAVCTKHPEDWR